MGDYYIYNGHLYSASELKHFKLGWTKPNHKWVTRKRSKDGKSWIYTYKKEQTDKLNKQAGDNTVNAASYDSENIELGKELDELLRQTGRANAKPDPEKTKRIEEIRAKMKQNKFKAQQAYSRAESAKRMASTSQKNIEKDKGYQVASSNAKTKNDIKKALNQIKTGELAAKIKNIGNKEAAEKAAKEAKQKYLQKVRETKTEPSVDSITGLLKLNSKAKDKYDYQRTRNNRVAETINKTKVKSLQKGTDPNNNVSKTNPNYSKVITAVLTDPESEETAKTYQQYAMNCSNCAYAYDLRCKGYDVEARANDDNYNIDVNKSVSENVRNMEFSTYAVNSDIADILKCYDGEPKLAAYTSRNLMNEKENKDNETMARIKNQTSSNAGRTYSIKQEILKGGEGSRGILTVDWNEGGGHALSYEVKNGDVIIIDAQCNDSYPMDTLVDYGNNFQFVCTDGLTPNGNALRKVKQAS